VEKVIQRCLDPNPSKRPPSALDVARALPGGDPLAEALAAGDTPSPEMVAASEDTGALSVRGAVACLALVVAVAAAMMFTANRYSAINMTPMPYSAENLELKAHETTVALGYTAAPFDTYRGFDADIELSRWMTMNLGPDERRALAAQGEPAVPTFEYGQSRVYLTPQNPFGTISRSDPERSPGAVDLQLDPQGRLRWLRVIPSKEPANGAAAAFDWNRLFSAAGLDMSRWTRADAAEIPPVPFDAQAAWTGTLPNLPKATLRIEAAAWKGRPVYFEMFGPWRPDRRPALSARADPPVGVIVIFVLVAISAPLFAVRNLRTSRGDLAGAARLGVILLIGNFATGLLTIHHTASVDEIRILLARLGLALLVGGAGWTLYMAVEPYVRRHWPQALIGWTRALGGNFRDPMVAGHILVGIAAGAVLALIFMAQGYLRGNLLGIPTLEAKTAVADWFNVTTSPIVALLYFFIFLLLRLVLRRTWIAVIAAVALAVFANLAGPAAAGTLSPAVVVLGLGISLYVAVGVRFGVLALAAMLFALLSFQRYPLTPNFSAWFAPLGLLNLALMMAIVVWCFKNALGGRKVFKSDILES